MIFVESFDVGIPYSFIRARTRTPSALVNEAYTYESTQIIYVYDIAFAHCSKRREEYMCIPGCGVLRLSMCCLCADVGNVEGMGNFDTYEHLHTCISQGSRMKKGAG